MQQRKGCVEYGEEGVQYACASLSSGSCVESDKADGRENYRERGEGKKSIVELEVECLT